MGSPNKLAQARHESERLQIEIAERTKILANLNADKKATQASKDSHPSTSKASEQEELSNQIIDASTNQSPAVELTAEQLIGETVTKMKLLFTTYDQFKKKELNMEDVVKFTRSFLQFCNSNKFWDRQKTEIITSMKNAFLNKAPPGIREYIKELLDNVVLAKK